jgi:hypothetical protein
MKKILLFIITITILLIGVNNVQAKIVEDYKLLEPLPCIDGGSVDCKNTGPLDTISFEGYVGYVYRFSIALAVFLTVVMIIIGGFEYMFAESFTSKSSAKDKMTNAALGLGGVLVSYLVLQTIDPRFVQLGVDIEPINVQNLKLEEVDQFKNQLASDMERVSLESLRNIGIIQDNKDQKNKAILDLEEKIKSTTDPEDLYQLKTDLEKLKLEATALESEQSREVYRAIAFSSFKSSISIIDDTNNYKESALNSLATFDADDELKKTLSPIAETYTKYTPKMGIEDKQKVDKENKFFNEQIKKEQDLMLLINKQKDAGNYGVFLLDLKKEYEAVKDSGTGNPEIDKLYSDIIKSRINKINIVLGKKQ